ncbi:MAG: hydroxylamine reductase [Cyanobacteriota bacterium]
MFCYQCEQTAKGTGCTKVGVCGKDSEAAALQDLIVYMLKGLSMYAHRARELGVSDKSVNICTVKGLFATVTNVNFDSKRLVEVVRDVAKNRDKARQLYEKAAKEAGKTPETLSDPADFQLANDMISMINQGLQIGIIKRKESLGEDITGLQELLTYGIKGAAAYADHAEILGYENEDIYAYFHDALNFLTKKEPSVDELLTYNLKCGEVNLVTMEILDKAHTDTFGHPEPTKVRITPVKGKAILVSGHDLKDLEELLKQTEGTGINIYTHGEMLPAHAYPQLKKYKHLAGNYGGAWQDQQKEFAEFPGSILMTTNCIIKPQKTYEWRIFTKGCVAWPGVNHINDYDFSSVINAAKMATGFVEDGPEKEIIVGFGRNAVLGVADKVIDAVKGGAIKHFFLVGGCDGAKPGRNYYTDFAEKLPKDCVILTLACGKYRFNKLEFGDIGGIPRLLDIGQCNDAYSAVQIAVALANAFKMDVNSLPLSMVLSWFEQKAVAILLSLLHLGIKDIRLGPSLPAFVTPTVLNVLVEKFNIKPVSANAEDDIRAILGETALA